MPVNIQSRDIGILLALARYGCLTRRQLQRLVGAPERIMRRRMKMLWRDNYVNRHLPPVADNPAGPPTPVYYPSQQGCELLAQEKRDDRFLLTRTSLPHGGHVAHSVAVSETHILLTDAIERQSAVSLVNWFNENEIVNRDEQDLAKLRTTCIHLGEGPKGKLLCKPDAVFGLKYQEATCIYLLEEDRNTTTGAEKCLKRKLPAFEKLFQTGKHPAYFEDSFPAALPIFRVLFIAPTPTRRDALRRGMDRLTQKKPTEYTDIWLFVDKKNDLTPEQFLHGEIFYPAEPTAVPRSLVKLETNHEESESAAVAAATELVMV